MNQTWRRKGDRRSGRLDRPGPSADWSTHSSAQPVGDGEAEMCLDASGRTRRAESG